MAQKLYIRPSPPHEVVEGLLKTVSEFSPENSVTSFSVSTKLGTLQITQGQAIPTKDILSNQIVRPAIEALLARQFLDITSISLTTNHDYNLSYEEADSPNIQIHGGRRDRGVFAELTPLVDVLERHFNFVRHAELPGSHLPDAERKLLNYAEKTIGDFAVEAARLAKLTAENTTHLSERLMEQTVEFDKRFAGRELELEGKHQKRAGELDELENRLGEQQKSMDTRENTAVRRELFGQIKTIIDEQKKIDISQETLRKRMPIHLICGLSILLSVGLIITFASKLLSAPSFDWHFLGPMTAGIALFVTTSVFYVKWNDDWFAEHAQAEFRNRKFKADIARASWLAELLFEWDKKRESQFPTELISSYTNGLFKESEGPRGTKHPYDDVKDLLKTVSTIRVGKGSLELSKEPKSKES